MTATDTQFENLSSQTANKFNFIFEKNVCIHDSKKLFEYLTCWGIQRVGILITFKYILSNENENETIGLPWI